MGHGRIDILRASERFVTPTPGIESTHLLSFGGHYDASRISYGSLIAHNDIRLDPGAGFEPHVHRDVEIVTWVVSGTLRHEDSTGHGGLIVPGHVQRLLAGTGVTHTERNAATEHGGPDVRFIQMWLAADLSDQPEYADAVVDPGALEAGLVVVAGGGPDAGGGSDVDWTPLSLSQPNATLHAGRIRAGVGRALPDAAMLHVFVVRGRLRAGSVELDEGDSALLTDASHVSVTAAADAEILVWALA